MIFHHVGIACKNISQELQKIKKIHLVIDETEIVYDKLQDANLCMITIEGGFKMEFVSGKPVYDFVKKGIRNYHLCYECEDINSEIEQLIANGAILVSTTKPAILFGGKLVAFLFVSYGLIELVQK